MIHREQWKKAAFLHERAVAEPLSDSTARARAEHRLKQWRESLRSSPESFAQRLSQAGLTEEQFLALLGDEAVRLEEHRADFSWLSFLEQLAQRKHHDEPLPPLDTSPISEGPSSRPNFAGLTLPMLRLGAARLRAGVAAIQARHAPGPPLLGVEAERALLLALQQSLSRRATRVLALELNTARLLGSLQGATPQERFENFSRSFEEPERLLALLQEYPVLARSLATTVERWLSAHLELLERVVTDRQELGRYFLDGRDPGGVCALQLGGSDLHRGGRSVVRLMFSSGLQLIYKPKALQIDVKFQQLLEWLNAQGLSTPHRTMKVLDRGAHGWVEFVSTAECDSQEALQRFYRRQGSHIALLYVLRAVDVHLENLIAGGEHPVLIDLESLFYHTPPVVYGEDAYQRAVARLDQSVLLIGLLPFQMSVGGKSVDLSGLGGKEGQVLPQPVLVTENAQQDTMRLVRGQVRTQGSNNRPRFNGKPANAADFVEEMAQGFEETYRLLVRHREELAARLRDFADVEIRHIVRPTFRYGFLQQESHHPDFLRDALDFDRLLDLLWLEVKVKPMLSRLIPYEQADLRAGDIPMFLTRPGSRDLWSSTGERIPDFFPEPSLTSVLDRLAHMSEEGCAEQLSLMRQAMVALVHEADGASRPIVQAVAERERPTEVTREELLEAAVSIGEVLLRKAIRGNTNATWIGVSLDDLEAWRWQLSPIRTSLYEGVGGVGLFFGYLAAVTGRKDFEELARACVDTVRRQWQSPSTLDYPGAGAYLGRSSHVYVMSHLANLFNDEALREEVLSGLPSLERDIPGDPNVDILGGVAGCARVMLGLHRLTGDRRALELARLCGERILKASVPARGGLGWLVSASPKKPLAGFSHGAAGFIWILQELAAATGDARYREAALQGLIFERSLFVPERGAWLDLRTMSDDPAKTPNHIAAAWCNGGAGIALGRMLALPLQDDALVREEIRIGLEATQKEISFVRSHCLCHGIMGNVDILHTASQLLQEDRWRQVALQQAALALRQGREDQWHCGLPKDNETPGLMLGLAGIGMSFLRLHSPQLVPCVLSLEAPCLR